MIKLTDILSEVLNEDRCKRIADRKYDKPSAYKSGAIVRCRDGKIWKDLKEEYEDNTLIGYHVTYKGAVDSIAKSGFRVGERKMQGKGFYAFYDKARAIGYAAKDAGKSGTVIVSFYVNNPEYSILYLNMEVAKMVLGARYHLKDQISDYFEFKGGLNYFLEQVQLAYRADYTMEDLLEKLNYIEENNSEGNQRTLVFDMIPADLNNKLNILWNGNYGIEFRINSLSRITPFKYEELVMDDKGRFVPTEITPTATPLDDILSQIPDTKENESLRSSIMQTDGTAMGIKRLRKQLEDLQDTIRNNRQYEELDRQINLLTKVIDSLTNTNEARKSDFSKEKSQGLHGWFKRQGAPGKSGGWVDCNTCRTVDGKKKCKACGRQKGEKRSKYPSCRPTPSQCSQPGKGKKWGKTNESEINREKIFPYTFEGKKKNDIEDSKKIMYLYKFKSDKHSYSVRFIKDGKGVYERSFATDDKNLGSTDENIPYKIYRTVTAITLDFLELANTFGDFQELVIEPISRERSSMVNTFITSYIAPKYNVSKEGVSMIITNK